MTAAGPREAVASFDLADRAPFSELALSALGEAREEIDALNVYPVPDGDTGTNMYLTFEAARDAMLDALARRSPERPARRDGRVRPRRAARRPRQLRRDHVQIVGALCKRLARGRAGRAASAAVFADGLARATEASYAAVGQPVEGTILTVARAAAEAAGDGRRPTRPAARPRDPRRGGRAAREALERTPDQLPVLRTPGSSTPAAAGSAWSSTPPRPP